MKPTDAELLLGIGKVEAPNGGEIGLALPERATGTRAPDGRAGSECAVRRLWLWANFSCSDGLEDALDWDRELGWNGQGAITPTLFAAAFGASDLGSERWERWCQFMGIGAHVALTTGRRVALHAHAGSDLRAVVACRLLVESGLRPHEAIEQVESLDESLAMPEEQRDYIAPLVGQNSAVGAKHRVEPMAKRLLC